MTGQLSTAVPPTRITCVQGGTDLDPLAKRKGNTRCLHSSRKKYQTTPGFFKGHRHVQVVRGQQISWLLFLHQSNQCVSAVASGTVIAQYKEEARGKPLRKQTQHYRGLAGSGPAITGHGKSEPAVMWTCLHFPSCSQCKRRHHSSQSQFNSPANQSSNLTLPSERSLRVIGTRDSERPPSS